MMIEYFNSNPSAFWFTAGFALLALDLLAFGLSSGFVLFFGFGALTTGGLMSAGIIPPTWLAGIASFGLTSSIITALLWKPLKQLQDNKNKISTKDTSSDFIGYEFYMTETISATTPGKTRYSGIDWRVEIDDSSSVESIEEGVKVSVISVDAGVFRVAPVVSETEK